MIGIERQIDILSDVVSCHRDAAAQVAETSTESAHNDGMHLRVEKIGEICQEYDLATASDVPLLSNLTAGIGDRLT